MPLWLWFSGYKLLNQMQKKHTSKFMKSPIYCDKAEYEDDIKMTKFKFCFNGK